MICVPPPSPKMKLLCFKSKILLSILSLEMDSFYGEKQFCLSKESPAGRADMIISCLQRFPESKQI